MKRSALAFRAMALATSPFRLAAWIAVLSILSWTLPWNFPALPWGAALCILILLKDLAESLAREPFKPGTLRSRDAAWIWLSVQVPIPVAAVERAWFNPDPAWAKTGLVVGACMALLGIILRAWAIKTLGRFFTLTVQVHQEHRLVQNGPYKLIRHPSYTGSLLYLLGASLAAASLAGILATLALSLPSVAHRMAREELALRRKLGEAYRDYSARTKKLVPYLF
ncbi:MAG: isoprenylcysteine carboxylmethyltransferase family protein [Deltaproteobacteria bacterium]|nr:isoprenylcysteine carboxylmethyltransferase family protein [Deltaproteobacteria bacterium]